MEKENGYSEFDIFDVIKILISIYFIIAGFYLFKTDPHYTLNNFIVDEFIGCFLLYVFLREMEIDFTGLK